MSAAGGGLGLYCGVAAKPGGDLGLVLAATKALAASERRMSDGDSTGDRAPSSSFCSSIRVGVEHSDGMEAGVVDPEEDDDGFLGGVVTASDEEPPSRAMVLIPATL